MTYPIWVTAAGDLGVIPQSDYFELVLQAYNDGDGFGARAVVSAVNNFPPYNKENIGIISEITILDGGSGYPNGYINVQAEGGVGFAGYAFVTEGRVTSITITNGGYGYSTEQTSIVFNKNLEFKHIAGELPAGMYVTKIGTIQGSPVVLNVDQMDKQFLFAVRATNLLTGKSADRSFSLTVSNITPPVIVQNQEYIGNYFDGSFFSFQLLVNDPIPGSNIRFSLASGALPAGLSLNNDGLISGYITPLLDEAYDGTIYYDNAPFSEIGYDSIGRYRNDTYFFSIHVNNGVTFGIQNYKMKITSRGNWSADTALNIVNIGLVEVVALEGTHVRADSSNVYIPIITTPVQSLPDARSGANFSFKFDAYDPIFEDFRFSIGNLVLSGFDQNSSDVYGNSPAYDMLAFPCVINNITGLINIQNNNYDLIDDKANITITANSYYPSSATITSTYYVNNTLITYLSLNLANSVTQGDTISQPSTGASGTVYISSGGTTIRLLNVSGTFASNTGNVFVANLDGSGNMGNTYIFRNGSNTTSAINSKTSSTVTYPTVNIFNPAGNIELYANNIGFSGTLYANITVNQPSNPPDYGTPYDSTRFDQSGSYLPLTITIDPDSGWLTGNVAPQVEVTRTYEFTVSAYKVNNPNIISRPVTYYITVLGDINNSIVWNTPSDLGLIDNGAISQLSIQATGYVNNVETQLNYEVINISPLLQEWIDDNYSLGESVLYEGFAYRALATIRRGDRVPSNNALWQKYTAGSSLPNGLKLLTNGYIVGRTSFQYFAIDSGLTTIDKQQKTSFDDAYWFTVRATSIDGRVSDYKTFKIQVSNYNRIPFENLYIKALPDLDQRKLFLSIVNNTDIFPSSLIYRIEDPWFGRAKDIRSLFLPGLSPSQLNEYIDAISTNHFTKRINFGNIRTARAVNKNFETKYEVVYLDLLDPVLDEGRSPANVMDLTNKINPWLDKQGNQYSIFYPNSLDPTIYPGTNTYYGNMKSPIAAKIGFSHQGSLPEWMTSVQEDGTIIGFRHAVVLAYTVPGASKLIAYRLQTSGLAFNKIDFVIDRYDLDNGLSNNFDTVEGKFFQNKETTFDRISRVSKPKYSVSYAIRGIPFQEINGKTVEYVQRLGGFDGATSFRDGELIVFAQQELFDNIFIPNDGWNGSDNIGNYVVPGYIDSLAGSVNSTLVADAEQGQTSIVVENTAGISVGYIVECGEYMNSSTTVQKIEGNTIYLENRYSLTPVQSILRRIPAGLVVNFAPINQRAGVWKIRILDTPNTEVFVPLYGSDFGSDSIGFDTKIFDITLGWLNAPPLPIQVVQLEFFGPVAFEDQIQVNKGASLSQSIIYYNPVVPYGYSVPAYTLLNSSLRPSLAATRFDSFQTKFIDNRDTYVAPQINDKYIKFPKFGVFK